MPYHCSNCSKKSFKHDSSSTDNDDSDYYNDRDPGQEVVEKNLRNRLQRNANHTKDELNKVLKRVDSTLHNYESSVQSSLIQHGMTQSDMSNIEHVADIKELEDLLNDSLAKQRYKQRLMIFIVGHTEQVSEKSKLLRQISQFFDEQQENFSAKEFNTSDDINEPQNEIDRALKSFDVKDCFIHVKALSKRLNELNEDMILHLIQNAGTKQQIKGKKKLAQITRETKEQLTNLQLKLEIANNEMINKDNKIETLEKELEINQKKIQDQLNQQIESYKKYINELEDNIEQYKNQIDDLTRSIQQSKTEDIIDTKETILEKSEEKDDKSTQTIIPDQIDKEVQSTTILYTKIKTPPIEKINKEIQTSSHDSDNIEDSSVNTTDEIDLNNVTTENLPIVFDNKFASIHIRELEINESINNETIENLKQEFNEYKILCQKEQNILIEKLDDAYQLQIKAQKTAEEALNQFESFMAEQEKLKTNLIHQETQTDQQEILPNINSLSEQTNSIEELLNDHSSSPSESINEEIQLIENIRRISLKEKYISLIEEKKHELDQIKQQAEIILSRSASITERRTSQLLENNSIIIKQQPLSSSTDSIDDKENQSVIQLVIKQDQQQQTSLVGSRHSSPQKENFQTDQFKLPFFHLYEIIHKFRHSIINILEQNKFLSLADCLHMIKQLSSDNNINDFIENSERVLKDTIKVLQTCITISLSTINKYEIKEKEILKESELIIENPLIDNQLIIQEKELIIIDLTNKYENQTKILNEIKKKYEEESNQNQHIIHDQKKFIQNLQQELIYFQKRLAKIENERFIEPSIMFTRLDAEQNEQKLQQAVYKGKLPETTYSELNEVMTDYVHLPSQQLRNLVKRYIQFRKTIELENRIQSEVLDNETKNTLEKMELLYERRSDQISERISNIRQQRLYLARTLTEKFDHLEDESSIFLIRPIYSYQGRTAVQSYMNHEKHRQESLLNENITEKRHYSTRQSIKTRSISNQQMPIPSSSINTSDDDERFFHTEKSFVPHRLSTIGQQYNSTDININLKHIPMQLSELTRLQELDIQRALMPMSHPSTRLLSTYNNNQINPGVPSLDLRSYVALSRPGTGSVRMGKPNEVINPALHENLSTLSATSQVTNPRTPYNSTDNDLKQKIPSLPPIKRTLINEKQHNGCVSSVNTNEVSATN